MPKHAAPAGPEGRTVRKQARKRIRQRVFRRRLEWLITYLPLVAPLQVAQSSHEPWYRYPLYFGIGTLLVIAAMCASGYGARLSARMTKPRSRAVYLLFACCWLAVAVPCGVAAVRLPQAGWQANALGEATFACAIMALVMLGRAAVRGRARRYFWLHPPGGDAANPAG